MLEEAMEHELALVSGGNTTNLKGGLPLPGARLEW